MSDDDRQLLELAGAFYRDESARVAAMHSRFGMTPTAFWQRVNTLLGSSAAFEHDPVTVNRLRRIRSRNSRAKSTRRQDSLLA